MAEEYFIAEPDVVMLLVDARTVSHYGVLNVHGGVSRSCFVAGLGNSGSWQGKHR